DHPNAESPTSARVKARAPTKAATASPDGSPVAEPRCKSRTASDSKSASSTKPVMSTGRGTSAGGKHPSIGRERCAVGNPGTSKNSVQSTTCEGGTGRNPIRSGNSEKVGP